MSQVVSLHIPVGLSSVSELAPLPPLPTLHVLTRDRKQISLSTNLLLIFWREKRAPFLNISVYKNGQLFQNMFPEKRSLRKLVGFMTLQYLPS